MNKIVQLLAYHGDKTTLNVAGMNIPVKITDVKIGSFTSDEYPDINFEGRVLPIGIRSHGSQSPNITKVIFNDPATIVLWEDGTKTVVKAQNGESFDKEKGLTMAITKKALGNKGSYFNEIKKWTEKD